MTSISEEVATTSKKKRAGKNRALTLDQGLADRLVAEARETGGVASLTGPDGVLSQIVSQILETALTVELDDHLGYDRHGRWPQGTANARNGTTPKTVHTDVGPVDLDVPRDRDGSFEPVVVPKHARRLSGFNEQVLSYPAAVAVWAQVQQCVVHLIRNSCKYVSRADRKHLCADLKAVYTAPSVDAAGLAFLEFSEKWSGADYHQHWTNQHQPQHA